MEGIKYSALFGSRTNFVHELCAVYDWGRGQVLDFCAEFC